MNAAVEGGTATGVPAGPALESRFVEAHEARAVAGPWRELFHACAEANPFYGPDFLLPLLALGGKLAGTRFLLVSHGDKLAGLLPILPRRFGLPGFGASLAALDHDFIFNALPLLRAGFEIPACQAMLRALETRYRRGVLAIGPSPLDGPAARALIEVLSESGRPHLVLEPGERVGIVASENTEAHLARIKGRALSKLRRNERELAKLGKLGFRVATSQEAVEHAVEAFMTLEAASWKGRQGSAFASDPATAAFAHEALAKGGDAPGLRAELLMLGERPLGIFLHLVSAGYSATFKIAHDEEFNRQAPGVLTMLHSLKGLLRECWTRRVDSGAAPEHAVGAIWQDRFPAGTLLCALSARQSRGELLLQARAQALVTRLRAKARDAYYALTRRKRTQARK